MLKIQKAKLADFKRVSELTSQLYNAQVPFIPHMQKKDKNHLKLEIFKKSLSRYYLLKENNKIKGFVCCGIADRKSGRRKNDKVFSIFRIVIDEKYRNQGLGKYLLEYALKLKDKSNVDVTVIGVYVRNKVAFNLYKKYGFKPKTIMLNCLKTRKAVDSKCIKKYQVNNAVKSDFDKIKNLSKIKENVIINTFSKIFYDNESAITKKELNKYLKDELLFTIKLKNKIIATMGACISHIEGAGQITRDNINIDFIFVNKKLIKKNEEQKILLSFLNKIKEIKKEKKLSAIEIHLDIDNKSLVDFYKNLGFFPVHCMLQMR